MVSLWLKCTFKGVGRRKAWSKNKVRNKKLKKNPNKTVSNREWHSLINEKEWELLSTLTKSGYAPFYVHDIIVKKHKSGDVKCRKLG